MELGYFHPMVVHFVIALAFVGVGARIVSLLPLGERFRFTGAMATALIVIAAIASLVAVKSGDDAHGPVERVPGSRWLVQEHERAGEMARNFLIGLAVLEILALALAKRRVTGKVLKVAAAVGGLVALFNVYHAAEHGGELVYNYAGGVGLRSEDSADVRRLLVAGLYHQAMEQRAAGRHADAARLLVELERQMPGDLMVALLMAESQLTDLNDPRGAQARLDSIVLPADSARLQRRSNQLRDSINQALQRSAGAPTPPAPGSAASAPARGASRGRP